jgi:mannose-6-phosphate isomerase-like protein (cupin superfamily)
MIRFETRLLPESYDYLAPDGSEIRLLPTMNGGGLAHCALPTGGVSRPVYHKTVEEIWFFLEGEGQVWRSQGDPEEPVNVYPGMSLTIPTGTHFQFRNTSDVPLRFIIVTMPPWPGPDEAVELEEGYWETPS